MELKCEQGPPARTITRQLQSDQVELKLRSPAIWASAASALQSDQVELKCNGRVVGTGG